MERILYLAHRIPYPPNKGDKIRSYHVLRYLAERYDVYLGAFIDDVKDWRYVETVQRLCKQTCFRPLRSRSATLRSFSGLLTGQPLTVPYYYDSEMAAWVKRLQNELDFDAVYVFSAAMAQYVDNDDFDALRRVIDFVDVDSDKWHQYSQSKAWPMSWVYRREGRQLDAYERKIAGRFDASLFVSAREADLFAGRIQNSAAVGYFDNGVDWYYFAPRPDSDNPYGKDSRVLVFTGAMDYWANVDAVAWFADNVFPAVRERDAKAEFFIVGARPTEAVQRLEKQAGVRVTGAVEDIRPYLEHAHAAVAPLRIARGVQNKVLEAMAMAKPVIASPQALEGIDFPVGNDLRQAETVEDFIAMSLDLLSHQQTAPLARDWVKHRYDWDTNLGRLQEMLDPSVNHSHPATENNPQVSKVQ